MMGGICLQRCGVFVGLRPLKSTPVFVLFCMFCSILFLFQFIFFVFFFFLFFSTVVEINVL